ncbi:probable receptor-like protein kinase At2g39360 [Lotus japonicus]|uniref:probable receptor-like protein kinase At2g39360 n=1 Tax=Lotus japonicus TaxID=34305 RepID=UPI0025836A9C|nr:probable receptor-like protein kinase At2g39360 [Lotus japonicus]
MGAWDYKFFVGVSSIFMLIWISSGDVSVDNIRIDCGSLNNTQVGAWLFQADNNSSSSSSHLLSTSELTLAKANFTIVPSSFDSNLYQTARILKGVSEYTFPIRTHGRHWIRLYFFPFSSGNYNMSTARFSVSAQNITLLKDFQVESGSLLKEYSLNITDSNLKLSFTPSVGSFAFINAIEILSIPDKVIPDHVSIVSPGGDGKVVGVKALETVARVNMGNRTVSPLNDTLGRLWVSDGRYIIHNGLVDIVSNITSVNFNGTSISEDIAPSTVYGTVTRLRTGSDPRTNINVTWLFSVDPGFDYFVRFHFCDIVNLPPNTLFNVYLNSWLVSTVDLGKETSDKAGVPYYMDAVTRTSGASHGLNVSVGTYSISEASSPEAILNGLEIMKISNSKDSLVFDSEENGKTKVGLIVGLVAGSVVGFFAIVTAFVLLCRRRSRRRNSLHIGDEKGDHGATSNYDGTAFFTNSKIGYRLPLAVIQEATDNFSEDLVIGSGGFGKVYRGVFKDETKVAVKRGSCQSQQGLAEFRTEIEMLSQFRHRHLVSLIGYCNEQSERIIIYEYMEKGSLKDHLFGSNADATCLSWKQRLEICIGAAKGLHYLHTGSNKAIIHRDVKSANILLDENLMAKVADFGLSKTGPDIDKRYVSTAVKGSFGYLDPEYLITQQLTEKSDVYSFGVVMFEVLCGRPVIDPSLPREKMNLVEWIMRWQERSTIEELVDHHLPGSGQIKSESLHEFVDTAKKCLAEHGINRPSMGDVLWHLEYALRLEGVDERSNHGGDVSSQIHRSDTGLSAMEYSMGSVGDMSNVSMSKVFAQMVKEDRQLLP